MTGRQRLLFSLIAAACLLVAAAWFIVPRWSGDGGVDADAGAGAGNGANADAGGVSDGRGGDVGDATEWSQGELAQAAQVIRVGADEWADLVTTSMPPGHDWVLLPAEPDVAGEDFHAAVRGEQRGFLTADACRECHADYCDSFAASGHARSSALPDPQTVLGSFAEGAAELSTASGNLSFRMIQEGLQLQQRLQLRDPVAKQVYEQLFEFGVVLGSGRHGQSYLWWQRDRLYQMHVSYLSETGTWVNSPGPYADGTADFSRPVPPRCLDCHATWAAWDSEAVNRFDRESLVLGISCVRCHGPAHEHIAFHRAQPDASTAFRIVNPSSLSVERQNEICAQCHSGGELLGRPFAYRPGTPLEEWLAADLDAGDQENADPHSANQLARLLQSKCYTQSGGMTCVSCHDPHSADVELVTTTVLQCRGCHDPNPCLQPQRTGLTGNQDCVNCHMPPRRDAQVQIETTAGNIQALLRDHLIGVQGQQ